MRIPVAGWLVAGFVLAAACGDDISVEDLEELPLQPTSRFPAGATFYLPTPAEGEWQLESAPTQNQNIVVHGTDGYSRFTPVVAGDYAFHIEGSDARRQVTVVDQVPFENYSYYPSSSFATVGDEIWVAHTFDPHISRIDPQSGSVINTIRVGPWPVAIAYHDARALALVAHKAGDTIGFVDTEAGSLVDALWVGDEPADIEISPDGATAYVSLATEAAVAIVDIASRQVTGRIAANITPMSMAISDDGATLYVASYRSSVSNRLQSPTDMRNDQFDIAVIDTATQQVRDHIESVGSVIGGLTLDGDALYVATTRTAVEELSGQEGMTAFRHSVVRYDTATLEEVVSVDLGRQESSTGLAVRPFGMAIAGNVLWVTVEGTDAVVGLDPSTLEEVARFAAEGRPRSIIALENALFVHGVQTYSVTQANTDGSVTKTIALSGDPRDPSVRLGQALYTGVGARGGVNHSCADCHVDSLTDGNVWPAGIFSQSTSRPMFWMEGSDPIGWEGDADELFSYLWGSAGPTIGVVIDTASHQGLYDYLASVVPPPPGNGMTLRDGSQSAEAAAGEQLFSGRADCSGCHAGSLRTEGLRLLEGGTKTEHPLVVPSLIGVHRHGYWLVDGAARSLDEAVEGMLELNGATLSTAERAQLVRYLEELTAREFFVLVSRPRVGTQNVASDGTFRIVLTHPALDTADNLARIELRDSQGSPVDAAVVASGRHVTVTPSAALDPGASYTIVLSRGFEAFNEMTLADDVTLSYTVASVPAVRLEGDYVITVDHPLLDPIEGKYNPAITFPVRLEMSATPRDWGATFQTQISDILDTSYDVVVNGNTAYLPAFAIPAGPPGFLNRSFPSEITLVDSDADGIADSGESVLFFRSPGLEATDVRWTLARDDGTALCEGSEGTHDVSLTLGANDEPEIAWTDNVEALGYYVTSSEAVIPAGPGPVTGGDTYWAIAATSTEAGFASPVSYGAVPQGAADVSETSGAPLGGASLPADSCIKLTVVFTDFSSTVVRYQTSGQ